MQTASLFLYNISIRLYWCGIYITSFFETKARLWIAGRKQAADFSTPDGNDKRIWFHCASLGEFEQARPLIEKIKKDIPGTKIILTFFSPSGYEIRKNYEFADVVLYLPLDTANNARQFLALVKPDVALFVKYEFWYHYLHQLKESHIPVILFSAVFRKEQLFFKWYGGFFRSMLKMFSKIFVQNIESKELLNGISVTAEVAFDTRFDRVCQIAQSPKPFPLVAKFKGTSKILIAGSTWKKDDELIVRLIREKKLTGYKFMIAPHDITEAKVNSLLGNLKNAVRLSDLNESNADAAEIIIVDSIGNLASLYAYAALAYVGGGFNASVHNVLEPAVYGIPVLFGPNHSKSVEARELIEATGAFAINGYEDLLKAVKKSPEEIERAGQQARRYVERHLGGVEVVVSYVTAKLVGVKSN